MSLWQGLHYTGRYDNDPLARVILYYTRRYDNEPLARVVLYYTGKHDEPLARVMLYYTGNIVTTHLARESLITQGDVVTLPVVPLVHGHKHDTGSSIQTMGLLSEVSIGASS